MSRSARRLAFFLTHQVFDCIWLYLIVLIFDCIFRFSFSCLSLCLWPLASHCLLLFMSSSSWCNYFVSAVLGNFVLVKFHIEKDAKVDFCYERSWFMVFKSYPKQNVTVLMSWDLN